MSKKYLDLTGLNYFWSKLKLLFNKVFNYNQSYESVNNSLIIDDENSMRLSIDKLYGNAEQDSTEGYNLLPCTDNSNFEETENGYKWVKGSYFSSSNGVTLKANTTYYLNLILFSKPTTSTTFTYYKATTPKSSSAVVSSNNFANINNYNLNQLYTKTYTPTEDEPISIRTFGNSNADSYEFQLWLCEGTNHTTYEKFTNRCFTKP